MWILARGSQLCAPEVGRCFALQCQRCSELRLYLSFPRGTVWLRNSQTSKGMLSPKDRCQPQSTAFQDSDCLLLLQGVGALSALARQSGVTEGKAAMLAWLLLCRTSKKVCIYIYIYIEKYILLPACMGNS